MRAIIHERYGGPEVLSFGEVKEPTVAEDAVLVRVHAISVNAYDWHMLRGKPYMARLGGGLRRPKRNLIGLDVAGVVEQVGPRVTDLRVGDRVFGSRPGSFAEYVSGRTFVPMPVGSTSTRQLPCPRPALPLCRVCATTARYGTAGGCSSMAPVVASARSPSRSPSPSAPT